MLARFEYILLTQFQSVLSILIIQPPHWYASIKIHHVQSSFLFGSTFAYRTIFSFTHMLFLCAWYKHDWQIWSTTLVHPPPPELLFLFSYFSAKRSPHHTLPHFSRSLQVTWPRYLFDVLNKTSSNHFTCLTF